MLPLRSWQERSGHLFRYLPDARGGPCIGGPRVHAELARLAAVTILAFGRRLWHGSAFAPCRQWRRIACPILDMQLRPHIGQRKRTPYDARLEVALEILRRLPPLSPAPRRCIDGRGPEHVVNAKDLPFVDG